MKPNIQISNLDDNSETNSNNINNNVQNIDYTDKSIRLNTYQVVFHLFKGCIGTGILGIPYAIKSAGILFGPFCLGLLSLMTVYCMHLIILCKRHIQKKKELESIDFAMTVVYGCEDYFPLYKNILGIIIDILIIITQTGFLCVYVAFIAASIIMYHPTCSEIYIVIILYISLCLICYTNNLKVIGLFSAISSIFLILALGMVFYDLIKKYNGVSQLPLITSPDHWPVFFGISIFAFEGIAVVPPIEDEMAEKQHFFLCLDATMGFVFILYTLCGFFGYAVYGDKIMGSVTLNFPKDSIYTVTISYLYIIAIFLSYPIQFYVPMKIALKYISHENATLPKFKLIFIRFGLIFTTCLAAILIPKIEILISLFGSFAASVISLVLPPFIYMMCFYGRGLSKKGCFININIILVGIIGCILGTYTSVKFD